MASKRRQRNPVDPLKPPSTPLAPAQGRPPRHRAELDPASASGTRHHRPPGDGREHGQTAALADEVREDRQPVRRRWPVLLLWLTGLGLVSGVYLVFKMFAMNVYLGDEHIYNYQAQLVADGVTPYADFAMAHPPLQALFAALVFKLVGFGHTVTRLFPILWSLAGGILLAVMVKREIGAVASITAIALYLLSYEPLRASSHFTGVNMTVALLLAAFLAFRLGSVLWVALFCVAAVFTRLYAIPGVLVLTVWALVQEWRKGVKLCLYGGIVGLVAVLALGIWAGFGNVVNNLVVYHAQKTPMAVEELARQNLTVLFHNAPSIFLFLAGLVAMAASSGPAFRRWLRQLHLFGQTGRRKPASARSSEKDELSRSVPGDLVFLCAATALVFLVVLLTMDRVWMYYYIPAFPFAAVVSGWLVSRWFSAGVALVRNLKRLSRTGPNWPRLAMGALLLAAYLASWHLSSRLEANLRYYQQSMNRPEEERVHQYDWRPGVLPDALNRLVRRFCWQDQRVIGRAYNRFNYLLWHESRTFDQAERMVEVITANTGPSDFIFGDSSSVPLLALMADRRIVANEVDTNIQRYRTGAVTPRELIERIDVPENRLMVLGEGIGVGSIRQVQLLAQEKYRVLQSFRTEQDRTLSIFLRRDER